MKTRIRSAALALSILLVLAGCGESQGDPTFEFGIAAPFTGQEGVALYGANIKNAVELAVDEINATGGVRGRLLVPRYGDTQLSPPTAVTAIQELISLHQVPVIIGAVGSSSTIAASPIATESEVVLISPASTSHEISGISPWVFRTIAPDRLEARAMAEHTLSQGHGEFGVAFVDNAGTRGPAIVFREVVEAAGASVSGFEVVPQGSADARTQISKILAEEPDAVYLLGYALELGTMIRQLREQDVATPIFSFQVAEEPTVREIAGDAAEGVVFTTPTIYSEHATGRPAKFITAYKERYELEPGIFAANAYDAVHVIAQVVEGSGFESEAIRVALGNVRGFEGASGTFDLDASGDSNQQPKFMVIRDGELEPLD